MSRQRKLRKLSADKPGTLLVRGFNLMHEQLGTLFGDAGGGSSHEESLQPAALRYLLTSALPQTNMKRLGEERLRELRTLATTLDQVVAGRVAMAGDTLMQRFKSLLMAVRDNSTAASRYLELIPMEAYPTASTAEEADHASCWRRHMGPWCRDLAGRRPVRLCRSLLSANPFHHSLQSQRERHRTGSQP